MNNDIPKLSEHDFLSLFISLLRLADIQSFDLDEIESHIIINKYNPDYKLLLNEFNINFKNNYEYSLEYRNAIKQGILSEKIIIDNDSTVYIDDIDILELIKGNEEYIDSMKSFINQIYDLNYESEFQEITSNNKTRSL